MAIYTGFCSNSTARHNSRWTAHAAAVADAEPFDLGYHRGLEAVNIKTDSVLMA